MDDSGIALDSPPIPLVDVNFDEVTYTSADHFGISLRGPSVSPPISPTSAPLLSSVSDPSTSISTIPYFRNFLGPSVLTQSDHNFVPFH